MWNYEDESVPWVAEFAKLGRTGVSHASRVRPVRKPDVSPCATAYRGSLVETIATHSHMIVADPAEAAAGLAEIRQFLAANPRTASGEFDLPLITWTFRSRLR
jgi:hypothetical protein